MTPRALINALEACGGRISVREGKLVVDAPNGALTPALREELASQKAAVLEIVDPYSPAEVTQLYLALCAAIERYGLDVDTPEFEAIVDDLLEAERRRSMPMVREVLTRFEAWRSSLIESGRLATGGSGMVSSTSLAMPLPETISSRPSVGSLFDHATREAEVLIRPGADVARTESSDSRRARDIGASDGLFQPQEVDMTLKFFTHAEILASMSARSRRFNERMAELEEQANTSASRSRRRRRRTDSSAAPSTPAPAPRAAVPADNAHWKAKYEALVAASTPAQESAAPAARTTTGDADPHGVHKAKQDVARYLARGQQGGARA